MTVKELLNKQGCLEDLNDEVWLAGFTEDLKGLWRQAGHEQRQRCWMAAWEWQSEQPTFETLREAILNAKEEE